MKKQQNPKRVNQNFFKFLSFLLFLLICTSAEAADLLDSAVRLEREGKNEEARSMYIQWLSESGSSESERFGRILIHTLRIPGTLDEDLNLIKKHLHKVSLEPDRKDVLKTALILSELSGNQKLTQYYLSALTTPNSTSNSSSTASDQEDLTIVRFTRSSDIKYKYIEALKENAGSPKLLLWIDRAHQQYPFLITEADWLYQLYKVLSEEGYSSQAEIFKTRLVKDFPESVETSLLNNYISPLLGPEELFSGIEESDDIEIAVLPVPALTITLYQVGAFQDNHNAQGLRAELAEAGLETLVTKDGTAYKVVVESHNDDLTLEILKEKGIEAFRIPQLP